MQMVDNFDTTAWLREQIAMETEGERTPIQIRADFERRGFCLTVNDEPIGKVYSQHKHAVLARNWLASEVRS